MQFMLMINEDESAYEGEGGAALGSQGFGLVQDGGDAALFGEGWERYAKRFQSRRIHTGLCNSPDIARNL